MSVAGGRTCISRGGPPTGLAGSPSYDRVPRSPCGPAWPPGVRPWSRFAKQDPPLEYESLLKPARAPLDRPHDRVDQHADGEKVGVIGRRDAPFHEVPSPLRTRVVLAGFGHVDETVAAVPPVQADA